MRLTVPTFMAECLVAQDMPAGGRVYRTGEVITLPYGQALILKAMGAVSTLVDETDTHARAMEQVAMYGADCLFPLPMQTIGKVADYLAAVMPAQPEQTLN